MNTGGDPPLEPWSLAPDADPQQLLDLKRALELSLAEIDAAAPPFATPAPMAFVSATDSTAPPSNEIESPSPPPTTNFSSERPACGVCTEPEDLDKPIAFRIVQLPCGHFYCLNCISSWWRVSGPKTCPHCKKQTSRTEYRRVQRAFDKCCHEDDLQDTAVGRAGPFKYKFCPQTFNNRTPSGQVSVYTLTFIR